MDSEIGAVISGGIVVGLISVEVCSIPAVKAARGYEHLIPVDRSVRVGDTYDSEKSIFLRDGVRVFPAKTDSEEIADLKNQLQSAITEVAELKDQIGEIQDALVEVGDIIAVSDSASDSVEEGEDNG